MKFKTIVIFFLSLFLFSCKGNKSNDEPSESIKQIPKNQLIVNFSFKTDVEDRFFIMMININVDEFQKKNIQIHENVPPSSGFERISAKFDPGNFSKSVRINLGTKQKEVVLEKIELSYKNNIVEINSTNFEEFVNLNDYVEFNVENATLHTKFKNGSHNPVLEIKESIMNSLLK
ncbi:MAG TPA: hypothetical protein PLZ00_07260 [Mangrovimonas sp.]|nr:hypothetical protein [Mangrovimonas sp.]